MLIYRFHHPFFHNAAWVRFMNVNVLPGLFILKSDTGTGSCPLIVYIIPKNRK